MAVIAERTPHDRWIINIVLELDPQGYDPQRAAARIREIGTTMRAILADAAVGGVTPLAAAMALARRRVTEGARPRPG